MDYSKELYFTPHCATTVAEVKRLFETLLATTWTIQIYRGQPAKTFNLKELGWTIEYTNKKRSAGTCRWKWMHDFENGQRVRKPYSKRVCLSMHFLSQAQNLVETKGAEWEEVIRHELAHAVDLELRNKSNHDRHWQAVAKAMLSNGRRTFSDEELKDEKPSKYTFCCEEEGCDYKAPSHRKVSPHARSYRICPTHRTKLKQVQNY